MDMRHFLLVGDEREVLGVWEAKDEKQAARMRLELTLSFPGCRMLTEIAHDFETFKARIKDYNLEDVVPEGALI
jgi:hypothetical protein